MRNKFRVPKRQWRRWDEREQTAFNELFEVMMKDTRLFLHPDAEVPSKKHWRTTAWNAAWMQADLLRYQRKAA